MRITGGQARGIPLRAPKGSRVRPTSDKVRKALFDTIGDRIHDAVVLDLFAGTGAVGIEALSRGARRAVLVERDTVAARTISINIDKTNSSEEVDVLREDFRSALKKLGLQGEVFDLVFIDPPYESNLIEEAVEALASSRLISGNTLIVVEHFRKTEPPTAIAGMPLVQTRNYGQTSLSYYYHEH
jgi:16S rRNA (guanine(966)-N(2))-methyltransferase RsmD